MLQVQDVSKVYRAAGRRLSFNRETAVCVILTGVLLAVPGVWKNAGVSSTSVLEGIAHDSQLIQYLNRELTLGIAGLVILMCIAGWSRWRMLLAMIPAAVFIWKILVPMYLTGGPLILTGGLGSLALAAVLLACRMGIGKDYFLAVAGIALGLGVASLLAAAGRDLGQAHVPVSEAFFAGAMLGACGALVETADSIMKAVRRSLKWQPHLNRGETAYAGIAAARVNMSIIGVMLLTGCLGGGAVLFGLYGLHEIGREVTVAYQALDIVDAVLYSMALILTVPFAAFMGSFAGTHKK
ncbi:MAG: YibE/F family protein [Lachnospiraceae bacterium]|jgi:uncharacterized membrane protein|nr:YibE/F family protein [Lachnospiraceae bacterium]